MHDVEDRIREWTEQRSRGTAPVTAHEVWERSACRSPRRFGRLPSWRLSLLASAAVLIAAVMAAVVVGNDDTTDLATLPEPDVSSEGQGEPDGPDDGATALWEIDTRDPPTSHSTSFAAFVTRLGCASGETGEVHDPVVSTDRSRVVVKFSVAPLSGNLHQCQSNNKVRHIVDLDEPIGGRELVDGACLSGDAVPPPLCSEGGVRWSP